MSGRCSTRRAALAAALVMALAGCGDDGSGGADDGGGSAGDGSMAGPAGGTPATGSDGDDDGDAAGDDGDGDAPAPAAGGEYSYSACDVAERVGRIGVGLVQPVIDDPDDPAEPYSALAGRVKNGVVPEDVDEVLTTDGDCALLRSRLLFCDPACALGEICTEDGSCQPEPIGVDMGTLELRGLLDGPIVMEPRAPRFNYTNQGAGLSYPAFEEGASITLSGSGAEGPALSLQAEGVAALVVHQDTVPVEDGVATTVSWDPPAASGRSRVIATLEISLHGGDPVKIRCDTDDDGSLEIPAALISELLSYSYSGFPAITLVRQTAETASTDDGCVELRVYSSLERHPVQIAGQTSCNDRQENCPAGQSCNYDLMVCE